MFQTQNSLPERRKFKQNFNFFVSSQWLEELTAANNPCMRIPIEIILDKSNKIATGREVEIEREIDREKERETERETIFIHTHTHSADTVMSKHNNVQGQVHQTFCVELHYVIHIQYTSIPV